VAQLGVQDDVVVVLKLVESCTRRRQVAELVDRSPVRASAQPHIVVLVDEKRSEAHQCLTLLTHHLVDLPQQRLVVPVKGCPVSYHLAALWVVVPGVVHAVVGETELVILNAPIGESDYDDRRSDALIVARRDDLHWHDGHVRRVSLVGGLVDRGKARSAAWVKNKASGLRDQHGVAPSRVPRSDEAWLLSEQVSGFAEQNSNDVSFLDRPVLSHQAQAHAD